MDWLLIYDLVAVTFLICTMILWPVFIFYSIRRIEKGIVSEGRPKPWEADSMGYRAWSYAWAILVPKSLFHYVDDGTLDPGIVRRYIKPADFWIALGVNMSSYSLFLMVLVGWAFDLY